MNLPIYLNSAKEAAGRMSRTTVPDPPPISIFQPHINIVTDDAPSAPQRPQAVLRSRQSSSGNSLHAAIRQADEDAEGLSGIIFDLADKPFPIFVQTIRVLQTQRSPKLPELLASLSKKLELKLQAFDAQQQYLISLCRDCTERLKLFYEPLRDVLRQAAEETDLLERQSEYFQYELYSNMLAHMPPWRRSFAFAAKYKRNRAYGKMPAVVQSLLDQGVKLRFGPEKVYGEYTRGPAHRLKLSLDEHTKKLQEMERAFPTAICMKIEFLQSLRA